ncbi:MAG: hypothetical protein ACI4WF_02830 [Bacilli bacterium]
MDFLNLFTEKELIIMLSVVCFLLLIVIILTISDILNRKKEIILEEEQEELSSIQKEEMIEMTTQVQEEVLENNNIEVQEVEEVVTDEEIEALDLEPPMIKKIETVETNLDNKEKALVELAKIEDTLEHQVSLEDTLTNLETIEEENAIISYQELLENTNELTTVMEDDGDEPITLDEVFKLFNGNNDDGIVINESLEALPLEEAYQGEFNSSPYLSPINGVEGENLADIQLENTANLEKLDKEIRKTNQFLNILNELKKNLE